MDGGARWAAVPEVAKSRTQRSDFTFTFHFHALEKEMQPTPVFLPGESQGRGSLVGCSPWGHTTGTRLSNFTLTFTHWRRQWHPTPVLLPGESQGRGSLVGCHLWGHTESDSDLAAAAAGLVAQLCLTLRPHGLWPTRLLFPWRILQARILE